jgi:tungstate transport system ATP-binding protein
MITVKNIRKSYHGRCVLDIGSFTFEPGRRYALVGANGSGKSTLLKIIAGTIIADSGKIRYSEQARDTLGYMPQKPYVYDFSVIKNVLMACNQGDAAQNQAYQALQKVGMTDFAAARGSRLSGGESQRVAFARMLVKPHSLLLLDEPTSAMDIAASDLVERELLDYCEKHHTTLIFATHSLAQAQRLADVLVLLHQGNISESGPASQIIHAPQTKEAQDFLQNWRVT